MRKGNLWLIVVLVCIIPSVCLAWIYPVDEGADGFRISQERGAYLGCYNGHCYNSYHLGEDIVINDALNFEESVYAISDGYVTLSDNKSGWGYVIIIRHESSVGDVCSLYGHLYQYYDDMPDRKTVNGFAKVDRLV